MRGTDHQQADMYSYISPEARVRADHLLRAIRAMADTALKAMTARSPCFPALKPPSYWNQFGTSISSPGLRAPSDYRPLDAATQAQIADRYPRLYSPWNASSAPEHPSHLRPQSSAV